MSRSLRSILTSRQLATPPWMHDPAAVATSWEPLAGGGANFRSHRLVTRTKGAEFRLTFMGGFFCFSCVVFPLVALVAGLFSPGPHPLWVWPALSLMVVLGIWMTRRMTTPRVFDFDAGVFYRARRVPTEHQIRKDGDPWCRLTDLSALQILSEDCEGWEETFQSYELNLVLRDGERLNVIDHAPLETIRSEATSLAEVLDLPVWDLA